MDSYCEHGISRSKACPDCRAARAESERDALRAEFERLRRLCGSEADDAAHYEARERERRLLLAAQSLHRAWRRERALLPAEMPGCKIRFVECQRGHGRLTADNWADHGCPWCTIEAARAEVEKLRTALSKINDIRNDIVGRQSVHFSQHIYPLVAALEEAGIHGAGYEKARAAVLRFSKLLRAAQSLHRAWKWERKERESTGVKLERLRAFADGLRADGLDIDDYMTDPKWTGKIYDENDELLFDLATAKKEEP